MTIVSLIIFIFTTLNNIRDRISNTNNYSLRRGNSHLISICYYDACLDLASNQQIEIRLLPLRSTIRILIIITLTYKTVEYKNNNNTITTIHIYNENNIKRIRQLIYSDLRTLFLLRRLILLIRMITTIIITNKENNNILTQQLNTTTQQLIKKKY